MKKGFTQLNQVFGSASLRSLHSVSRSSLSGGEATYCGRRLVSMVRGRYTRGMRRRRNQKMRMHIAE